ncbi:PHD finger protein MALE MEIOCYTE DEATH 1 [Forsythia ovata]|uniref:PHD finger protein MALE MEIOCYTE DEATH 1 n=1 Tax=Forsythia ovata TaxID=205694 RepID=A0ABD1W8K5_9LAMI
MSSTIIEACNKGKMRKYSKLLEFENFASPVCHQNMCGSFRENIRLFLQDVAELEDYTVNGMPIWCILIVSEHNGVFPLYTIEETVQHSIHPFCDHCKLSGWGHHYVSKRRYHFIIPAKENRYKPLKGNFSELQNHNLHGLIHCNGYGHLICINGFKEKSIFDNGSDIMDLWDRVCTTLKAR